MEKSDQFSELFRMQKALNERIGVKTDGMSEAERTKWLSLIKPASNDTLKRRVR